MGMIVIKKDVIDRWAQNKTTPPKTHEEIANHIGVSVSLFDKIMMGIRQVTPNVLRKLCELTGYDVGDLATFDRNREPEEDN